MTKTENGAMTSLKNCRNFFDIFLQIVEFTGLPNKQFDKTKLGYLENFKNIN
jgi:hypothetical protein